jgi:hypothetical protein
MYSHCVQLFKPWQPIILSCRKTQNTCTCMCYTRGHK